MPLALTKTQARAVYDAMLALGSIRAKLSHCIDLGNESDGQLTFTRFAYTDGYGVNVRGSTREQYASLDQFAAAYGLHTKRMRCSNCGPVGTKAFFDRTSTGWECRCCGHWQAPTRRENEQSIQAEKRTWSQA